MKERIQDALPSIIVVIAILVASCVGVLIFNSLQREAYDKREKERQEIYEKAFEEGYMAAANEYDDLFEKISPDWFHDGYAVGYDEGYDEGYFDGSDKNYSSGLTDEEILSCMDIDTIIDYLIGAYDIELDEQLNAYGFFREGEK